MKLQITFLGTGSAIPTVKRNHSSILLNYKEENLLIDCGEGTQRQFRLKGLNPCKVTRLLITHFHGDHVFGMPGFFQTLYLNNYQKTLYIYGPSGTKKFINNMFENFIQAKKIDYRIIETKDEKFFENKDFELCSFSLEHDSPTNGYVFKEKDKLRINKSKLKKLKINEKEKELGKLIEGKDIHIGDKTIKSREITYKEIGKKISFVFDTKTCNNAIKLAKDSDIAIIESTLLSDSENGDKLAEEYKHLTAKEAATIAKKAGVKKLYLTHISQRYEKNPEVLLKEARKIFKNTYLAEDFMDIYL